MIFGSLVLAFARAGCKPVTDTLSQPRHIGWRGLFVVAGGPTPLGGGPIYPARHHTRRGLAAAVQSSRRDVDAMRCPAGAHPLPGRATAPFPRSTWRQA